MREARRPHHFQAHTQNAEPVELTFPPEPIDVVIPKEIAEKLIPISTKIGEAMKIYGFRISLNSKTLLKALALMKGKIVVTEEELNEFLQLSRFLNSDFNPI